MEENIFPVMLSYCVVHTVQLEYGSLTLLHSLIDSIIEKNHSRDNWSSFHYRYFDFK
jgi:hypothetical protein